MSILVIATQATIGMNTARPIRETVPLPRPSPVPETGLENQSENEAPSGRVTTYATQKGTIGLMLNRHHPIAGTQMTPANRRIESRNPKLSVVAVKSPAAV